MNRRIALFTVILLMAWTASGPGEASKTLIKGGVVRGDIQKKGLALVFTGDSFAESGSAILDALAARHVNHFPKSAATMFWTRTVSTNARSANRLIWPAT